MNSGISNEIRSKLVRAIRAGRRSARFTTERPTDWRPHDVLQPGSWGVAFTKRSAWEFIAEQLEDGVAVRERRLDRPPGAKAYEFTVDIQGAADPLYVKIELSRGEDKVYGRSFHPTYKKGPRP